MKPAPFMRNFLRMTLCAALAWLALSTPQATASNAPHEAKKAGKSALGGPFTLTDHTGRTVTDKTFRGKYMLMYFGYTSCADVCPTDLSNMVGAMQLLGPLADQIQPIFVSIDPKRDTIKRLAEYVTLFDPRLIGLTGTDKQIEKITKAYLVSYFYFDSKDNDEYEVAHSAKTYLMGPDGRYRMWFRNGTDPESMAAGIRRFIEKRPEARSTK